MHTAVMSLEPRYKLLEFPMSLKSFLQNDKQKKTKTGRRARATSHFIYEVDPRRQNTAIPQFMNEKYTALLNTKPATMASG